MPHVDDIIRRVWQRSYIRWGRCIKNASYALRDGSTRLLAGPASNSRDVSIDANAESEYQ
jgi:hypothetical protein